MMEYKKPLPRPNPWSQPFWDGCRENRLLIQKCEDCGEYVFYPKRFCPFCLSDKLNWAASTGKGKVYSFTVVHSYQPTEFADDVPYIIAVILLDEGVRLMSNIVECPPEDVRCDMEVEVVFDPVTAQFTLPKFKPVAK